MPGINRLAIDCVHSGPRAAEQSGKNQNEIPREHTHPACPCQASSRAIPPERLQPQIDKISADSESSLYRMDFGFETANCCLINKSEPAVSFKLLSELFFGCSPVHRPDIPKFEILFGLSEFFAVPRRALNERFLGCKVGPKRLHNLKFFPAGKLAQLGDAHGIGIYAIR